jgi:cobyrinic acid a,c-diamide synthase
MAIAERHLGLVPANELAGAASRIGAIGAEVAAQVDLDAVLAVAARAGAAPGRRPKTPGSAPIPFGRVAYPRDAAFGFYYPEDLEALAAEGLSPVPFDSLRDPHLPPDIDGLFLGGGFPEAQMDALEANRRLRCDIRAKVAAGLPVHAECGGLMVLSRAISWNGRRCEMVGALDAEAVMFDRPQGHGNVVLRETGESPWPLAGGMLVGHEFHHAGLVGIGPKARFAYEVVRGHGIDGRHDGLVHANTVASFTHLRAVGADPWPHRFAALIRRCRERRPDSIVSSRIASGGSSPCPTVVPLMPATPSVPAR